jgi:transitional endoplasmic reticulum ATPase
MNKLDVSHEKRHTGREDTMTTTKKATQAERPAWATMLSDKYRSGIAYTFMLHGNTQDYVAGIPGQTLRNYLLSSFKDRTITVYWNMESGFSFSHNDMRTRFAEIVGLTQAQPQTGRSGLASGLNATVQSQGDIAAQLAKVRNPAAALEMLSKLLRYKPTKQHRSDPDPEPIKVAVVLDYAEFIAPEGNGTPSEADRLALVTLSEWSRDNTIANNDALIVMVATDIGDVNERLRRSGARWEQIEIPFPTFAERVSFARFLVEQSSEIEVSIAPDFAYEDFARLTTGLRFIDIEDVVLRASFEGVPISRTVVKARKDEIMNGEYGQLIQIEEAEFGFSSIGGMVEMKQEVMRTIIQPMRTGNTRLVPQGLLLIGPPGTGKTRFSYALSKEAGFTFVVLQLSKIFHKFVGDTERNLDRALYAIKAMAPCIVFIDEVDQAFSRGESGDSGVSNRLFKRVMEFMSDTTQRGKIIFIGATNRPDLMDKALLRPGRFDRKYPFFVPTSQERADILSILTKAVFSDEDESLLPTPEQYQTLAERMTDEYTGAEVENLLVKAASTYALGGVTIFQALEHAYEVIIPSTGDIESMTNLALLYSNDLDLVPVRYRETARKLRHPDARRELQAALAEESEPISATRRRREL